MKEKNVIYYLLRERTVAKREKSGEYYNDFLFKGGKWVEDEAGVIMDYLVGFDSTEPIGSPYRFGCTSMLMEIEEISEKKAVSIMNQQILGGII
ncbi:MAG: hypothetical protein E7265_07195 [Lachnospiraceae bacterium]|nr:hypothetical protein [Lachnospiraceae bacterium]